MAESSISVAQGQFNCSVCLDLLKDPVTIPCGHSYCMSCITGCWDLNDQKGVYSCPQCRQTFTPRPVLGKNTMLAEVVENLRKRKQQTPQLDHYFGEPGDVECDVCTGDKNKAIKSCLVCLESYCQTHFERHEEFHSRKRHKVTDAIGRLQEMICPQHDRLLEMYCRTDQICVCMLCMANEHKTHDTVSPDEERTEKQKLLEGTQKHFRQRIQERQKEIEELREAVESHKRSAQAAVTDSERIFTELIRSIERSCSEVTQLIRDQEKVLLSQAEERLKQLEQEIDDLRRRDAELEQLPHTDDHIHFLQSFQSLSDPSASTDSLSLTVSSRLSFDDLRTFASQLEGKLQRAFKEEKENLCRIVRYIEVIPTPEYKSREEFLQYYQRFTLDSNSAHKYLRLSELNRTVTNLKKVQRYPDHPDRFTHLCQVFCRESVCGRSYWEVEWAGIVDITMSYKSIKRKAWGDECEFGCNDKSWCLICSESGFSFGHNYSLTEFPEVSISCRIGVYVDHSAGTLSFYSVSDTMTLIHRVHTTFTQPLYPAFLVCYNSQVKFCDST
ncbi:E3 ubiquitin/ISG15 ligase TRIM25-like [Pseudorasbora parva]|uniref:E3 ubiquitin/ISG15 ligase TRIM25-like n=1 Tax=Pseudorasbora parva TaxID=51549 RepID=UPI00351E6B1D